MLRKGLTHQEEEEEEEGVKENRGGERNGGKRDREGEKGQSYGIVKFVVLRKIGSTCVCVCGGGRGATKPMITENVE